MFDLRQVNLENIELYKKNVFFYPFLLALNLFLLALNTKKLNNFLTTISIE